MSLKKYILIIALTVLSAQANAYMSLAESAEITRQDKLIVGGYPQVFLNEGGGVNVGVFADMALAESLSVRANAEVGKIDMVLGASVKFTPFPDVDNQPAIGFRGGFTYARDENENIVSTHIAALVSKKIQTDQGIFNPYVGIPVTFSKTKDENKTGTQFIVGTEFFENESATLKFGGEVGISLKDSYSSVLGFVTYSFDR